MSVEQANQIDYFSVDEAGNRIILTITDHMNWSDPIQHMRTLQEKLNGYIAFWEGGQMYRDYPTARGREVVISIAAKYPLNPEGAAFVERARGFLANLGIGLEFTNPTLLPDQYAD